MEEANRRLLTACGIADLDGFAAEVQRLRRDLGQPSIRWAGPCLLPALQLAVTVRGWPADKARHALPLVATAPAPAAGAERGPPRQSL